MAVPVGRSVSVASALAILRDGEMTVAGRVAWSSNATLVVEVRTADNTLQAVYKPRRGERPLWDFPAGTLCLREMAAFVVSQALGWGLVPPTVLRDGPLGFGAVQLLIAHDPEQHYLSMRGLDEDEVRRIATFDVITNNADRKSGHILRDEAGQLWLIDHGLTFHAEGKLRTVVWDFAGQRLPDPILAAVRTLGNRLGEGRGPLRQALEGLLTEREVRALRQRIEQLVASGRLPEADPTRRSVPWPLV